MAVTLVNHDPQSAFRPIANETLARQAASRAQHQRPQAHAPPQPHMGSHVIPQNTQVRAASAPETQDTDFTPSMFAPPSNHVNFSNIGFDDDQWPSFGFNAGAQSNGYQHPLDKFDEAELLEMQNNPEANIAQGPNVPLPANSVNADEQLTLADLPPVSTQITSTPAELPRRKLVSRNNMFGSTLPQLMMSLNHVSHNSNLVQHTHITPLTPTPGNKENQPTGPSRKQPHDAIEEEDDEGIIAAWGPDEDTPASPNKKSVRAADLNPSCQCILDWALSHYQFLTVKGPYPTAQEVDKRSVESWYAALKEMNQEFNYIGDSPPTEDELALIKMQLAQLRGQIKVHARSAVAPFYGFKNSSDINTINGIHETVQTLKHKHAFVHRNYRDTKEKGSLYRTDLIASVINLQWYDDKLNSEAIHMPQYFADGMFLETIALIAAGIECAIDEWRTSTFQKIAFTAKAYEKVYDHHLRVLQNWEAYSSGTGSMATQNLWKDLLAAGKECAGLTDIVDEDGPDFTDEDFACNE